MLEESSNRKFIPLDPLKEEWLYNLLGSRIRVTSAYPLFSVAMIYRFRDFPPQLVNL